MVLRLKQLIMIFFYQLFKILSLQLVRRIIKIVPRLSVAAPPGIICDITDYLGEFTIHVDTTYAIERRMLTGDYERDTLNIIKKFVNKGDVCFDIGANIGAVMFALAQKVAHNGKVYAFEPGPPIFKRLAQNVASNPHYSASIIIEKLGVSEKNTQLNWSEELRWNARGNGSLRVGGSVLVDVVTLDSYCYDEGITKVDFIKIDVEGMEHLVLKGAEAVLTRCQPILYFETLPNLETALGFDVYREIADYLGRLNYNFFSVDSQGDIRLVDRVGVSLNTLAIPRENSNLSKINS